MASINIGRAGCWARRAGRSAVHAAAERICGAAAGSSPLAALQQLRRRRGSLLAAGLQLVRPRRRRRRPLPPPPAQPLPPPALPQAARTPAMRSTATRQGSSWCLVVEGQGLRCYCDGRGRRLPRAPPIHPCCPSPRPAACLRRCPSCRPGCVVPPLRVCACGRSQRRRCASPNSAGLTSRQLRALAPKAALPTPPRPRLLRRRLRGAAMASRPTW